MIIKSFNPMSVAKLSGAMYAAMGFIFGAFMALISLFRTGAAASQSGIMGVVFGMGAIIFLPIMYGILGLVSGFIGALIYNFIAGKIGGIEIVTE